MLHFQINGNSGVPVYRQLIDQIKYYIASGSLQPGDQLPSIREFAQKLAVNPTTIVRVYSDLEHEKVIEMRHGKGAFVSTKGPRFTPSEKERNLRVLAKQLVVEAAQMDAPASMVLAVVREQLAALAKVD